MYIGKTRGKYPFQYGNDEEEEEEEKVIIGVRYSFFRLNCIIEFPRSRYARTKGTKYVFGLNSVWQILINTIHTQSCFTSATRYLILNYSLSCDTRENEREGEKKKGNQPAKHLEMSQAKKFVSRSRRTFERRCWKQSKKLIVYVKMDDRTWRA